MLHVATSCSSKVCNAVVHILLLRGEIFPSTFSWKVLLKLRTEFTCKLFNLYMKNDIYNFLPFVIAAVTTVVITTNKYNNCLQSIKEYNIEIL